MPVGSTGRPLRYAQPDPYLPDLVVCHPSLAEAVADALAGGRSLGAVTGAGSRATTVRRPAPTETGDDDRAKRH